MTEEKELQQEGSSSHDQKTACILTSQEQFDSDGS